MNEQIIICMPLKNGEKTVRKSIISVVEQTHTKREIVLLIGNDNSTDNSEMIVKTLAIQYPNIVLLNVNFGKAYLNRNFLNDYARQNFPNCVLIGRLDADDVIVNNTTISKIEALYEQYDFDVLMCGNKQIKNGIILEWENKPRKSLLTKEFLANQLFEMTQGNPKAELPSCNTFIKPNVIANYPNQISAEDHFFTVSLLLQKENLNIHIDEDLLYCIYSLDGFVTHSNRKNDSYAKSRKSLYTFYNQEVRKREIEKKWNTYITTDGLSFHLSNIQKNKSRLEKFWSLSYPTHKRIEKEILKLNINDIQLLDVGCGPFPKSGIFHQNYTINRTLIDALADDYHLILAENSINTFGQKIIPCKVEEIESQFNSSSFDVIFSKNALDHTYNPIKAISSLIKLLKNKGVLILEHYVKEGEYTNYFGLHQWDFFIENNCFYIADKSKNIHQNVNHLFENIDIESSYEGNKIINILRKNNAQ